MEEEEVTKVVEEATAARVVEATAEGDTVVVAKVCDPNTPWGDHNLIFHTQGGYQSGYGGGGY